MHSRSSCSGVSATAIAEQFIAPLVQLLSGLSLRGLQQVIRRANALDFFCD